MEPDLNRLALSIQQPWAELILRGVKTIEIRQTAARPGMTVYLYTSRRTASTEHLDSPDSIDGISLETLPRGVIVGTVEILECRRTRLEDAAGARLSAALLADKYSWILGSPQRLPQPLQPRYLPFGTWFYPFERREQKQRQRRKNGGV